MPCPCDGVFFCPLFLLASSKILSKFFIKATDGNNNPVASQKISFSDFPYDLATVWLVDGCLMLPTEY